MGPQESASRALESLQKKNRQRREYPRLSPFQLDGTGRLALHLPRTYSDRPNVLREAAPDGGPWRNSYSDRTSYSAASWREAPDGHVPDAFPGLYALHGGDPIGSRYSAENYRRDDSVATVRARESRDRSRPGRLDGAEKARGLLLMAALQTVPDLQEWLTA